MSRINLIIFTVIISLQSFSQSLSTRDIVEKMLISSANIHTISFTQKAWEKMSDGVLYSEVKTKICTNPYKFYCYNVAPSEGLEVLYNSSVNPTEATVKPNGFPWVNLNLDPGGSLMRKGQHHCLYDAGFDYAISVLKNGFDRSKIYGFDKVFLQLKDTLWNGHLCYTIQINSLDYKYVDYVVQENEDVIDIAKKKYVNEYSLLLINPSISDYNDVGTGQKIKIPTAYAKKTVLYVDKETFLPIVQIMYDEKGIYEKYEYLDLKINPSFQEKEFTVDCECYGF